jgi:hypothetical protein
MAHRPYVTEPQAERDYEANAEADPRDWSAEYRCACGAVADTTVYHDSEPVKRSCVDCAMSFTAVLTEPLPRKIR